MKILKNNDRTWCFWKTNDSLWEQSISKMGLALFANENFRRDLDLQPYTTILKGLIFTQVFDLLSKQEKTSLSSTRKSWKSKNPKL
jgi:lycopene beta-cyclase